MECIFVNTVVFGCMYYASNGGFYVLLLLEDALLSGLGNAESVTP